MNDAKFDARGLRKKWLLSFLQLVLFLIFLPICKSFAILHKSRHMYSVCVNIANSHYTSVSTMFFNHILLHRNIHIFFFF